VPGPDPTREELWSAAAYLWLEERIPSSGRGRVAVFVVLGLLLLGLAVFMFALPETASHDDPFLLLLSFLGLFLICFASSSFVLFPIPGLALVALALVFQLGGNNNPYVVGVVAALGWTLGDATIYIAGAVGTETIERQIKVPERFAAFYGRVVSTVERLMTRFGFPILASTTTIPNPVVGVALLAAGSNRMRLLMFVLSVSLGRLVRGLVTALLGARAIG
jgi:membrane protein YqaA with SNARE-associated domain